MNGSMMLKPSSYMVERIPEPDASDSGLVAVSFVNDSHFAVGILTDNQVDDLVEQLKEVRVQQ